MNCKLFQVLSGAVFLGAVVGIANLPLSPLKSFEMAPVKAQTQVIDLEAMTVERLGNILQDETSDLEGNDGQWQLTIEEQSVLVLADETNNRMRIVAPIAVASTLSVEQVEAMLVANFHSALDARYAVANGTLVSVFVHPLSSLQEADLRSGLRQVVSLATTFGTSYSSGELGFGSDEDSEESAPSSQDRKFEI
ncbi:MAG: hypothetical protein F6K42_18485 [Leptolyngbya sp. SIO1D8]|nr:hypothetical protein [Leptolyngbya sp. SIO1D8]